MTEQPTNNELRMALAIAKELREESDLKRLRDRRTTWVGVEENQLRRDIDVYLRSLERVMNNDVE